MKKLKELRWIMALIISCLTLNSCEDDPMMVDWASECIPARLSFGEFDGVKQESEDVYIKK